MSLQEEKNATGRQKHGENALWKMEGDITVTHLQAKEPHRLPATSRNWKDATQMVWGISELSIN